MFGVIGWEAGIRTPISASRARSPTVERPPSRQAETRIIAGPASSTQPFARLRLFVEAFPQVPAGHGPVRRPLLAQLPDAVRCRPLAQPVLPVDGVDDADV